LSIIALDNASTGRNSWIIKGCSFTVAFDPNNNGRRRHKFFYDANFWRMNITFESLKDNEFWNITFERLKLVNICLQPKKHLI